MKISHKRIDRRQRRLEFQTLETRQLLAAEFGDVHEVEIPADLIVDGLISSADALMVINRLAGQAEANHDGPRQLFDVNRDGNITTLDALRVINRMQRPPRANPDQGIPPRDSRNDQPIAPTVESVSAEIRSIDGTGNNVENPLLGSAGTEFRRLVDSDYADGISAPTGEDRPSARWTTSTYESERWRKIMCGAAVSAN